MELRRLNDVVNATKKAVKECEDHDIQVVAMLVKSDFRVSDVYKKNEIKNWRVKGMLKKEHYTNLIFSNVVDVSSNPKLLETTMLYDILLQAKNVINIYLEDELLNEHGIKKFIMAIDADRNLLSDEQFRILYDIFGIKNVKTVQISLEMGTAEVW